VSYRLFPEATGLDMLEDVGDFWRWAHAKLPTQLTSQYPGLAIDLSRIAVTGESAGGFLTLVSGISFAPEAAGIRVLMAQYCTIDPHNAHCIAHSQNLPMSKEAAQALLSNYMAGLEPGAVRIASPFPERLDLAMALMRTKKLDMMAEAGDRFSLSRSVKTAAKLPPVWILQGEEDSLVSVLRSLSAG
jgi:acetyl esterase/lipase